MGQKRSNAGNLAYSSPQFSRVLAAPEETVDSALAALFASSVGCQIVLLYFLHKLTFRYPSQDR